MMQASNVLGSRKRSGRHESEILTKLIPYFENKGYDVIPHSRFNIAWGSIISDIDLLLIKENNLGLVEIKSSKDDLRRAGLQIKRIKDYVDFVYVATNYKPRNFQFHDAGLIYVNGSVQIIKEPKTLEDETRLPSVYGLQKKCLQRLLKIKGIRFSKSSNKVELARMIIHDNPSLRDELKEIVTCGLHCETMCPIWNFKQ